MKLYTKRGDSGQTDLFGGRRVDKDDLRIEAFGCVDELNSFIGLAICACENEPLRAMLVVVQSRLFELGADLSTPLPQPGEAERAAIPRISDAHVSEVEGWIDQVCEPLAPMRHFVLPGGTELAARLHVARAVCRRAERIAVRLSKLEAIGQPTIIYLNRLSDLLFAMARRANQLQGVDDVPWTPRG